MMIGTQTFGYISSSCDGGGGRCSSSNNKFKAVKAAMN